MKKLGVFLFLFFQFFYGYTQQYITVTGENGEVLLNEPVWKIGNISFNLKTPEFGEMQIPETGVDLGLKSKTLWSPWNFGATSDADPGLLIGWGDVTASVKSFDLKYYPTSNPPVSIVKSDYDIVHKNWGDQWRLPKLSELQELLDDCTWEYTTSTIDGSPLSIPGFKVTGTNGNSIFFPMTNYREGEEINNKDTYYWTGSLDEEKSEYAFGLSFNEEEKVKSILRSIGAAIRPVYGRLMANIGLEITSVTTDYNTAVATVNISGEDQDIESASDWTLLCYNFKEKPDTIRYKFNATQASEKYVSINGLDFTTDYACKAFAVVYGDTIFSNEYAFMSAGKIKIGKPVDMGAPLGTSWSDINLGASQPKEVGQYYYWGDPSGENIAPASDNVLSMRNIKNSEYDVAHALWGGNWRLPTYNDFKALIDNCEVEYDGVYTDDYNKNHGVYKLTSKTTKNSIYITDCGYIDENSNIKDATLEVLYWTANSFNTGKIFVKGVVSQIMLDYVGSDSKKLSFNISQDGRKVNQLCISQSTYLNNSDFKFNEKDGRYSLSEETMLHEGDVVVVSGEIINGTISNSTIESIGGSAVITEGYGTLNNPYSVPEVTQLISDKLYMSSKGVYSFWYRYGIGQVIEGIRQPNQRLNIRPIYDGTIPGGNVNPDTPDPDQPDQPDPDQPDTPDPDQPDQPTEPETPTAGKGVDLGLSVEWADINIGAINETDFGYFIAWGELEPDPNSTYTKASYEYMNEDGETMQDLGVHISGTEYDAARYQWGGDWRMPTKNEMFELIMDCTWTWVTKTGSDGMPVRGLEVTGSNGNKIFLPDAGFWSGTSHKDQQLRYWLGSYDTLAAGTHATTRDYSYSLKVDDGDPVTYTNIGDAYRYHGMPIRPVRNKKK